MMAGSLDEYKKKRKFDVTPEPKGKVQKAQKLLRFVVQKHDATRLHYDFRLELEGVLKSWAVPKGPSLNPADKRLAMMVEDHPMEYEKFEGIIPEGNYGAGTVMVWDEGTYEAAYVENHNPKAHQKALSEGLKEGNLKIIVHGHKIKGEFALVKIKNQSSKGNEWLLLKKNDKYATEADVTKKATSVLTKRTLEQIHRQSGKGESVWSTSPPKSKSALAKPASPKGQTTKPATPAKLNSIFHEIEPMLATLTDQAIDHPGWIYEIKWDGYRAIAEVNGKHTFLYSRNKIQFGDRYPEVLAELKQLKIKAVLDGEIVVVNTDGHSDFQSLQNYGNSTHGTLVYYVFDILYFNGEDLTARPLSERKEILKQVLVTGQHVRYNDHILEKGTDFFKTAKKQNIEGIIGKKLSSVYVEGSRTKNWIKVKSIRRQEAIVVGFTRPKGIRKFFGALVLGMYKNKKLVYVGNTGSGFNQETLHGLYQQMTDLMQEKCALSKTPPIRGAVTWVKPELICEVTFQEWTKEGIMRVPIFKGFRGDKQPTEVTQESETAVATIMEVTKKPDRKPKATAQKNATSKSRNSSSRLQLKVNADIVHMNQQQTEPEVTINQHGLTFTNLQKVYWAEEGYTKKDLIEYYNKIAPVILPYLKDRPQNLRRNPNGAAEASFFQKNMPDTIPDWIETIEIFSESNNENLRYMLCQEKAALLYMANLGCIEINPWLSRKNTLDHPDYIVIDLDPQEVPFEQVIETALAVKSVLDKGGIEGFPKTSGSRGLHIFIPMGAKYNYDQARQFAELIASLTHQLLPGITSLERSPEKRRNKIYLDYLQNRTGQTLAAPYCVRPRAGATVSAPLVWKEVKPGLSPLQFTIKTIFKRLQNKGDIFRGIFNKGVDLSKSLARLR